MILTHVQYMHIKHIATYTPENINFGVSFITLFSVLCTHFVTDPAKLS